MRETIKARGEVDISVYENGKLVDRLREENLVVDLGRTNITKLLGGDVTGKAITQIAVGDNNADPEVADNDISNAFVKALEDVTYPADNKVMFHFDIDNTEANGLNIWEFGLITADNVLFARKVRSAVIAKTNTIRLVGTWAITIN